MIRCDSKSHHVARAKEICCKACNKIAENTMKKTEMLLSERDIERLEQKGYGRDFFVRFDSAGYASLRNYRGYCVFYDAEKRRCKVRAYRPLGCRIYHLKRIKKSP